MKKNKESHGSKMMVNGELVERPGKGQIDPNVRATQLLLFAVQCELYFIDPRSVPYNPRFQDYVSIKNKMSSAIRFFENQQKLHGFCEYINTPEQELKSQVELIENADNEEVKADFDIEKTKVDLLVKFQDYLSAGLDRKPPQSEPSKSEESEESDTPPSPKKFRKLSPIVKKDPAQAEFQFNGETISRVKNSLFLFSHQNRFRLFCLRVTEHEWFNNMIMLVIVFNAISIASYDKSMQNKQLNDILFILSAVFCTIYVLEAAARIVASGFLIGKNTYLRSPANLFDFFIVVISILQLVVEIKASEQKRLIAILSLARVLRVVRLLSSFYKFEQMRQQLRTIGGAIRGLMTVLLFLMIFYVFLAIIGLQLFSDNIYNACRLTPQPVEVDGKKVWERAPTDGLSPGGICSKERFSLGGFKCPAPYTCGSYPEYGLALEEDGVQFSAQLYYNVAIFKNFGGSLLTIFQLATADTWGNHMYNLINSSNFIFPVVFCFAIHMLGTYYIMNLVLVIIMESYIENKEVYAQDDIKRQEEQSEKHEAKMPSSYKRTVQSLTDFVNFQDLEMLLQHCEEVSPEPSLSGEKEQDVEVQEVDSDSAQPVPQEEAGEKTPVKKLKEPEIEDSLHFVQQESLSAKMSGAKSSEPVLDHPKSAELALSDIQDKSYVMLSSETHQKLLELNKCAVQLQIPENKQAFLDFMAKSVAVVDLENVEDKIAAERLVGMELNLLMLKFENVMRDKYKEENHSLYGLRQEKKVLTYLSEYVCGKFDNFASRRLTKKEKIEMLQQEEQEKQENAIDEPISGSFLPPIPGALKRVGSARSMGRQSFKGSRRSMTNFKFVPRDEMYWMRKKARLEQRDRIYITLHHMRMIQKDLKNEIGKQIDQTALAAQDLLILTHSIADIKAAQVSQILESRIKQKVLYEVCYQVDTHWAWATFIALSIVTNFIVLALESYPSDPSSANWKESANIVFYFIFLLEMIIKMVGNGVKIYFWSGFNIFDFVVVTISTVEIIVDFFNLGVDNSNLTAIRALRVFRLLRMFKLAKFWKSFGELLNLLFLTLNRIGYLTIIMVLFLCTYAILGKELFAYKLSFVDSDYPIQDDFDFTRARWREGAPPPFNFDSFGQSFNSVFLFFAVDGWSGVLHNALRMPGVNSFIAIGFFFTLFIFGNMVIYQLFRAILLREFDNRSILQQAEQKLEQGKVKVSVWRQIQTKCCQCRNRKVQDENFEEVVTTDVVTEVPPARRLQEERENNIQIIKAHEGNATDMSCYIFSRTNPVRKLCTKIINYKVSQKKFKLLNAVVYAAIAISSLTPAFQSPLDDENTTFMSVIDWIDFAMIMVFTFESVVKTISSGFFFNGPKSYLKKPSNMLDFLVVVISLASLVKTDSGLGMVKVLRISTRLARPLRLLFRDERLKISIQVLTAVLPQIFRLLAIYFLFCLIFATIGVNLLKGRSFHCNIDHASGIDPWVREKQIINMQDCFNLGGTWQQEATNWDNIIKAFIQLFTMTQAVGWTTNMLQVMSSTGINQEPTLNPPFESGLGLSLFMVVWMIVGYFFIQNLFVGVIIAGYNRESEKHGSASISLTQEQRKKFETDLLTFRVQPLVRPIAPKQPFRAYVFRQLQGEDAKNKRKEQRLKLHQKPVKEEIPKQTSMFDYFISFFVILNALILTLKWPNMNPGFQVIVEVISYICAVILILEAVLKITAYGKVYFVDSWNKFDFVIAIGSLIFISPLFKKERTLITFIRTLKLFKLATADGGFEKLQTLYAAIARTMLSLMNVSLLMFMMIYIFAIVGCQSFATVKLSGPMTSLYNFQTVPKSILTLYRVLTRDHWNELMEAVSVQSSVEFTCIKGPSYQDYVEANYTTVGCGKPTIAVIYFFTYSFLISVVFLSLFIAIILSAYLSVNDKYRDKSVQEMIERFRFEWSHHDPHATGKVDDKTFEKVLFGVGEPFGLDVKHRFDKVLVNHYMQQLGREMSKHLNDDQGLWYFDEVLDQLLFYYLVSQEVQKEMEKLRIKFKSYELPKRTKVKKEEVSLSAKGSKASDFFAGLAQRDAASASKEESKRQLVVENSPQVEASSRKSISVNSLYAFQFQQTVAPKKDEPVAEAAYFDQFEEAKKQAWNENTSRSHIREEEISPPPVDKSLRRVQSKQKRQLITLKTDSLDPEEGSANRQDFDQQRSQRSFE